jgi:A/G-specific adenine glycosylase
MRRLHAWFEENRREFPWRKDPSPYQVWISEVMLQQTRASVVIPYFERWMALFPDVVVLAAAPIEKVIKAWEGLGYYSRARNLHEGAKQIVQQFGGQIPPEREALASIRGLGPYTVGAILSFGFRKRAAAIDGNVMRVLTRYLCIEENISKQATKRKIALAAESLLDVHQPWVTMEALIELGATVCTPKPKCDGCPLNHHCLGRLRAESLPIKNGEKETIRLKRAVVLLEFEGRVLVRKGEKGKVMADLYEFPYFEMGDEIWTQKEVEAAVLRTFSFKVKKYIKLDAVMHTFTRYKAHLYPSRVQIERTKEIEGYEWVSWDKIEELPFSSGHRRIKKT